MVIVTVVFFALIFFTPEYLFLAIITFIAFFIGSGEYNYKSIFYQQQNALENWLYKQTYSNEKNNQCLIPLEICYA